MLSPVVNELPPRIAIIEQDDFALMLGTQPGDPLSQAPQECLVEVSVRRLREPLSPSLQEHRR